MTWPHWQNCKPAARHWRHHARAAWPGSATFETVNTLGLPLYARSIPDRDRDEWVRLEIESNPLPICTRPQVLRSARRT
jgi:major capsid protein E